MRITDALLRTIDDPNDPYGALGHVAHLDGDRNRRANDNRVGWNQQGQNEDGFWHVVISVYLGPAGKATGTFPAKVGAADQTSR
jgi:hypothetical protein